MDQETMNANLLFTYSDELVALKQQKKDFEEALADTNRKIQQCEEKMVALMDAADLQNFKRGENTFYQYVESYPSVSKDKEFQFFDWLREHGEDGIIKESIHPQTLRSWYKQMKDQFAEAIAEKGFLNIPERIRVGVRNR